MAEYIEREVTCEDCVHYDICIFHPKGNENKECVRFKNKADVVEVVRCKDCKWFNEIGCAIRIVDDSDNPKEDDFCSFGERKDGAE